MDYQAEIVQLAMGAIVAIVGIVARSLVSYLKKKGLVAQIENNKTIVKIAVNAIEQLYTQLHGQEKFNLAKIEAKDMLNKRGIKVSEKELDMLIENSVKEMNKSINEELKNS